MHHWQISMSTIAGFSIIAPFASLFCSQVYLGSSSADMSSAYASVSSPTFCPAHYSTFPFYFVSSFYPRVWGPRLTVYAQFSIQLVLPQISMWHWFIHCCILAVGWNAITPQWYWIASYPRLPLVSSNCWSLLFPCFPYRCSIRPYSLMNQPFLW